MTRRAKHPKTAKMTFCPSWRSRRLKARTGGMTMAARAARRSAAKPGSTGAVTENRGRCGGIGASVLAISVPWAPPSYSYTSWMIERFTRKQRDGLAPNRERQKLKGRLGGLITTFLSSGGGAVQKGTM